MDGVHFCAYKAGHVLGAAMFMIEIAGVKVSVTIMSGADLQKILYTGDYSREEDRHLDAAEIPPTVPDVLITVCNRRVCDSVVTWCLGINIWGASTS